LKFWFEKIIFDKNQKGKLCQMQAVPLMFALDVMSQQ